MERKLRIAQYGYGKMSVYTMRYAIEKGAEIVCAFGRSSHSIGKDIGEIAGVGKTGVLVQDSKDAVAIMKETKPDACIIATASLMQDIRRPFMDCAESGLNAITLCEEAFYPWNSAPRTTEMLDESRAAATNTTKSRERRRIRRRAPIRRAGISDWPRESTMRCRWPPMPTR